jgi:CDP-paratose 2-epimerase
VPKWIVTGGAGFIGSNATVALAREGISVVAVDNLSRPSARLNVDWLAEAAGDSIEIVRADVRDFAVLDDVFAEHADTECVLHLAGQVAVTTSVAEPRHDFDSNALGTFNALEATRRHLPDAVFLNASTNKVYGQLEDHRIEEHETRYVDADYPGGVPESHPLDPHSPYGCSKAAADVYTLDYARVYGLRAVSLRQSCIYGPRQFGIEDQGWVAWFAIAARLGLPITLYGNGKQVRDLLHVDDLVALYVRVFEQADEVAGRAYNVGGGPASTLSLLELLDRLGTPDVHHAAPRPGDQKVFVADASRARTELGWSPQIPLDEGIEGLLGWVERNADTAAGILQPA